MLKSLISSRLGAAEAGDLRYYCLFAICCGMLRRPETSATKYAIKYAAYNHLISISHTAMMWQTLPASTKKWKTVCMKRRLRTA